MFVKSLFVAASAALLSMSSLAAQLNIIAKDRNGTPMVDVVASLTPVGKTAPQVLATATGKVEQKNFKFDPLVTIVQRGTKMRFPNLDKKDHHVKVLTGPTLFEFKIYTSKEPTPVALDSLGKITIHCLLHNYMVAHIFVVDTPWYGKSDESGILAIDNVPDGEYELTVDHPAMIVPTQLNPAPPKRVRLIEGKVTPVVDVRFDFVQKPAAKI
jgi:plastocyanin